MSEKRRTYLYCFEDILSSITKIESYVSDITYDAFCQSPMIVDAVIRNLEVIGEAAGKIPGEIRSKYSEVEWRETISFRNVLIHHYFDIDIEAVWDTIRKNITKLKNTFFRHTLWKNQQVQENK